MPSVYVFSYFPFGFEGRIWDLIVSVPDHCLSFYFEKNTNVVYATNILKMTIFLRTVERPYPKKIQLSEFTQCQIDYKRYKVLRGTIHQDFVLHAFKSDDELGNEIS